MLGNGFEDEEMSKIEETFSAANTTREMLYEEGYSDNYTDYAASQQCNDFWCSYLDDGLSITIITVLNGYDTSLVVEKDQIIVQYENCNIPMWVIPDYRELCGNEEMYFQRSTLMELLPQKQIELLNFYYQWLLDNLCNSDT